PFSAMLKDVFIWGTSWLELEFDRNAANGVRCTLYARAAPPLRAPRVPRSQCCGCRARSGNLGVSNDRSKARLGQAWREGGPPNWKGARECCRFLRGVPPNVGS